MDTDQWYERVDWEIYREEKRLIQDMDDADIQAEHGLDDDKRLFRLTDFFVFDKNTLKLSTLNPDKLDHLSIAGRSIPIMSDENTGEDDPDELEANHGREVRLSAITKIEYTYLDVSAARQDGIYVLTCYGWYLLEQPIGFYHIFYQEPFRQFRLALVILRRVSEYPKERLSEFINKFRRIAKHIEERHTRAIEWGYPALHPADLQDSSTNIIQNIEFFIQDLTRRMSEAVDHLHSDSLFTTYDQLDRSPTIASIRKGTLASIYRKDNAPLKPEPADITEPQPPYVGYERGDHYDVTFDAHESDEDMMDLDEDQPARASAPVRPVCVTPTVERIARQVFSTPLNRVGAPLPDVTWRHSRAQGTQVAVDAKLKRGQCIMVPTGIGKADAQQDWAFNNERTTSANAVANNYRFARIISIASGGKRLHVRWFDHSAKSDLLKEFERPMELFLTNRCAWLAREHVERLVDVEFLSEDEEPPHREKGYYVRFIRDHHSGAFIRVQSSDYDLGQSKNSCLVCDQAQLQESRFEEDCEELRLGGVTLHKGEFVAIHPYRRAPWLTSDRDSADPSAVVQIRHIYRRVNNGRREPQALYLRGFERVELLRKRRLVDQVHLPCKGRPVQDERRLCSMDAAEWELTLDFESAKKAPVRKCFVRHPESFSSTDEMNEWLDSSALHYIVNLRGVHAGATAGDESRPPRVKGVAPLPLNDFNSISACTRCKDDSLSPVPKMRMLDLFGGVGGLSKGLVQAGICELKYMVDHNSSACAAYSTNFPKAKSIHGDVNVVLSRTILAAEGRDKYLAALNDQDRSSLLPKQGEIDFICGGPPCQSFSGANRFKRDDDPRTAMVAAVMSAVEHYHPKYFLIENVPNALTHKITGPVPRAGSADSEESVDPPPNLIEQGILRFLMRVTLDLGYSFRFGVLEASQYGAPQRRRRAFILGARSNMTLPEFPLATHRVSKPETGIKLPTGGYLDALKDKSGFALHPAVTVWDAISDLKPFDWVNPHILVPQTQNTRNEERDRLLNGIPAFVAVRGERREIGLGADDQAIVYRQDSPTTTYQMEARKNARWVTGHYTSSFVSEKFVERVVTIPLSANADHRTLPEILRRGEFLSNVFGSGGASGYYRGAFGRYDRKGQFATILTSLRPAKKNGFCIHPEQKRMLTMRELARGQGFPDDFVFSGSVDEVNRQIGNAVAVQVSRAIGKEIKKAMIKDGLI